MRRTTITLVALAILAAGCGDDATPETTETSAPAPSTTASTVAPTTTEPPAPESTVTLTTATEPPAAGPAEIAEQVLLAFAAGDYETWRGFLDPAASTFDEVDWIDDFDGDGVPAPADYVQFSIALSTAIERKIAVHGCEPVSEIEADCSWTRTSAFYELADLPGVEESFRYVVENGLVVSWWQIDPPEVEDEDPHREARLAYERWVHDNHADRYAAIFREPCCDLDMVRFPAAVPIHEEFMAEYFKLMREE